VFLKFAFSPSAPVSPTDDIIEIRISSVCGGEWESRVTGLVAAEGRLRWPPPDDPGAQGDPDEPRGRPEAAAALSRASQSAAPPPERRGRMRAWPR